MAAQPIVGFKVSSGEKMKSPHKGLARIWHAAGYSWKGLKATWKSEEAFRQESYLMMAATPVAFFIANSVLQLALLVGVLLLLLVVELLNSAIESVVDRTGSEFHELSGRAKDQGSAAVLLMMLIVLLVWGGVIYMNFIG
jgi:diacylglycerol kinase (ATP)